MSDEITGSTVTESAPTSTSETAEQVYDAFEQTETTGVEVSGETPEPAAEPAQEAATVEGGTPNPAEPTKELSDEEREAEALLSEFGYKDARKPDGREHWMPRSKALKMIANGLRKGRDRWTGEKTTVESERDRYRSDLQEMYADIQGDPRALVEKLAGIDPRYKGLLEPAAAQTPPAADAEMPQPDITLQDGSKTYSLQGLTKLLEWNTGATTKRVLTEVDSRLKPYQERDQQAQRGQMVQAQMQEAAGWPMFGPMAADGALTPFQQEVLGELRKDSETARAGRRRPTMTLRQAYLEVYSRHQAPEKVRERVLKELNSAPRSTSVPRQSADLPRQTGPVTTQDAAARALARLERGG